MRAVGLDGKNLIGPVPENGDSLSADFEVPAFARGYGDEWSYDDFAHMFTAEPATWN